MRGSYESMDVVRHRSSFAFDGGWRSSLACGMTLILLYEP